MSQKRWVVLTSLAIAVLAGCASKSTTTSSTSPTANECLVPLSAAAGEDYQPMPAARHVAWLDGDYQTDYEPDQKAAEKRLVASDGKVPEMSDTESYLEYLATLNASGRSTEAEKRIKDYLSKNPTEKRAIFLLGVHYLRTKKRDMAQFLFGQLEKDPGFAMKSLLFNNLGMLALQDKNRPLAIEYFEKATKAQPPTAAPFVNLGSLYLQSRSYAEAEKLFTRAVDIDDDFEDAVLGLGGSLEGQGKFAEAHKAYADFISSHPNATSVLFNDAVILGNRLKNREEAAQVMLRYIQRGGKETAKAHEIIQSWR